MSIIDIQRLVGVVFHELRGRQEEHPFPGFRGIKERRFFRGFDLCGWC
jgi:hypothetical protein